MSVIRTLGFAVLFPFYLCAWLLTRAFPVLDKDREMDTPFEVLQTYFSGV